MSATAAAAPEGTSPRHQRLVTQLWFWVLIAIAAGIVFGLVAPESAKKAKWLADAFIQLIKTVTGPVIFVTVVIGIASLGNLARAGGLALRALAYFFCATVVALTLGLLAANIVKPGSGFEGSVSAAGREAAKESISEAGQDSGVVSFITGHLLPTSFVQPFVDNEILQVLVIAILTAAAVSMLPRPQREQIVGVFEVVSRVIFGIIRLIMWVAPIGAFGGMAFTVAQFGGGSLKSLGLLMVTFWGTCAIFVFGVLGIVARLSGFSIFKMVRLIKDELLIIVGTSSSETVLPRLLAKLEAAGASRQTVGVVIPTGYSFNLDGTCIYLTLGAMFIIQASGQDMSIGQQIALAALMVLTSKGAAGITGAGLVTLTASLQAFGGEFFSAQSIAVGIALVVGIDRIMSEGRALTNATGNSVATMVIARWQGERDEERFQAVLAEPSIVDREVEQAMRGRDEGVDARDGARPDPRFERDTATGAHVPAGRDAER
jgi:aerobic C4-dicarboxylate transport protein